MDWEDARRADNRLEKRKEEEERGVVGLAGVVDGACMFTGDGIIVVVIPPIIIMVVVEDEEDDDDTAAAAPMGLLRASWSVVVVVVEVAVGSLRVMIAMMVGLPWMLAGFRRSLPSVRERGSESVECCGGGSS